MRLSTPRRLGALLFSLVLLAALTVTTASPVAAAKVSCQGKVATIVGTKGPDVLVGTDGADVIAGLGGNDVINGRGGNDLICGGPGRDRLVGVVGQDRLYGNGGPDNLIGGPAADLLFGGTGNDILSGRTGNDRLNGGPGTDTCYQDAGSGPLVSCELPAAPPPVVAPPPAPPPDPIDLSNVLAIAYTDLNRDHVPNAGDVMIAQFIDTDANGPDNGDTIKMGMYPTTLNPVWPADFAAWGVKNHTVLNVLASGPSYLSGIQDTSGGLHYWFETFSSFTDEYREVGGETSRFLDDYTTGGLDVLTTRPGSPSQAAGTLDRSGAGATGDDYFLDVEVFTT